jgi:uncharacterized membrane protein YjjP (DUF1212 family)
MLVYVFDLLCLSAFFILCVQLLLVSGAEKGRVVALVLLMGNVFGMLSLFSCVNSKGCCDA